MSEYSKDIAQRCNPVGMVLLAMLTLSVAWPTKLLGQPIENRKYGQEDKFRQLEEILPTPNSYRNAAGEPGPEYWQQRCDYVIDAKLDDAKQQIEGKEQLTYHNHSPHTLRYVWLQVDANIFRPDSDANLLRNFSPSGRISLETLERIQAQASFDGGANITRVADSYGQTLNYTIVKTMMRVELPQPLAPSETFRFEIEWNYQINDSKVSPGRTGCEYFEKDKNYIYEVAQWFPRMVAYTDAHGWQHKQFLGTGEFTLELGDYLVRLTVPSDHIVAATGVLQNSGEVLTEAQRERLTQAHAAARPMFIVTPEEAAENQKTTKSELKTWIFHAQNVRDFAWASSRKFIWDAQGHDVEGNSVMAMSYYPNEGEPLWSKYSTQAIIHTLNVYSRYTFAYPYPTAISVNGPVYGMEYPMICFNGPRPDEDGTYAEHTKYGLISVIIHEVGHNYFPMIVNSDERQWTWMDEGLNTFLQYLSESEWEEDYPSVRGEPAAITGYMASAQQVPIMTNSESILQFGNNAYAKPATALNILRETVLGRELFDYSFKEYARRWKFKRPMPADFFRTMEDASGVDLDWFWRGWFYSTEHCDIAIDKVTWTVAEDGDPDKQAARKHDEKAKRPKTPSDERDAPLPKRVEQFSDLKDFYNSYDPLEATPEARAAYQRELEKLSPEEKEQLQDKRNFYTVTLKNVGGLVMPIILRFEFDDGSKQVVRLPAEAWVKDNRTTRTSLISAQRLVQVELDPQLETADTNRDNNYFPPRLEPSHFELFKSDKDQPGDNPMKSARQREEKAREEAKAKADKEAKDTAAQEKEKVVQEDKPVVLENKDAVPESKPAEGEQPAKQPAAVEDASVNPDE
ncbi:MAG: M1 family metallopeptidase [Aureliella sp.]